MLRSSEINKIVAVEFDRTKGSGAAVSKSGTGTRGQGTWGLGDSRTWGRGRSGTRGLGDVGTQGLGDLGMKGRGDVGCGDSGK